ncbi:MAG: hypothetical protein LC808_02935 [Actinobacteria bacterium]|nr:hypothetical protein [Actinomycetota bacterium]
MGRDFATLHKRLDQDTLTLFGEMVEAHLATGTGDRLFIRADSWSGCGLIFSGKGNRQNWDGFNGGSLDDLCSYGLLHQGHSGGGNPNYRVSADGTTFYTWLRRKQGTAVDQTEQAVLQLTRSAEFAARHPGAAHHLGEAFELLSADRSGPQVCSEIGDHLRKAIMDTVTDLLGGEDQEQPATRLDAWLDEHEALHPRERQVLADLTRLTRSIMRLDHRLNHIRDEASKGQPAPDYEEVRRAAFLTAVVCYELDRVPTEG